MQLVEIARHNNVKHRNNDRKLLIAKAIVEQTDGKYIIPEQITPANQVPNSRVKSLSDKKRSEYLKEKADLVDNQWRNVMTEEEFAERPLRNRDRRIAGNLPVDLKEKIAVYSNRDVFWKEVGRLPKGYSFITREEAEPWLRIRGVRLATPSEVAAHFDL